VRELVLFRLELGEAVRALAKSEGAFTRDQESRAQRLIDNALSFVTLTSIREDIGERDRIIAEYTGLLERANRELQEQQSEVTELHRSRMHITRSLVHDLRNFLNAFSIDLQLIARSIQSGGRTCARDPANGGHEATGRRNGGILGCRWRQQPDLH
jgi:signal transduction histidine kinase